MSKGPRRRKRRDRYEPERPLSLDGQVMADVPTPPRGPRRARVLRALARTLPTHEESRKGRGQARVVTLIIGAVAVSLVAAGGDTLELGLLGVLVACTALFIPLPESRQQRWLRRADALDSPGTRRSPTAASLHFDGKKLTIRSQGRVWRSLKPDNPPHTVSVQDHGEGLRMVLAPPSGHKKGPLAFDGPPGGLPEVCVHPAGLRELPGTEEVVTLDGEAFRLLHRALVDPPKR